MRTITKGDLLAIGRGILEGIFGLLLLFAAGLSVNLGLVVFAVLLAYLILILLDQDGNVFEFIGIVIGLIIAAALRTIDERAMAYVAVLVFLILVRWIPAQKTG